MLSVSQSGQSATEVMLQWNDGTWEHRAYWGGTALVWVDGTASRRYMGPLPGRGPVVNESAASQVNLERQHRERHGVHALERGRHLDVRAASVRPQAVVPRSRSMRG